MKKLTFTKSALVTGINGIDYLETLDYKRAVIVTGGSSMFKTGVIDKVKNIMAKDGCEIEVFSGVSKNPTTTQVLEGVNFFNEFKPDIVVAVGGGSAIDAAKVMMIFYEHPEVTFNNVFETNLDELDFKCKFVAVPSTSGTGTEVTHVGVVTFEEQEFKLAIKTEHIRPDVAILDGNLPHTLPKSIAAETGMDALTHAMESYINKNGDDFTDALAKEAIEGIMEWLPISYHEGSLESRAKVHNYQCMAAMAFSNSGLGMVHGIAHAFGGKYDTAHGLANAVILPYAMEYNKKDPSVAAKFEKLSRILGGDVIEMVKELSKSLNIPGTIAETGITEPQYKEDFQVLLDHSMKGATVQNPIEVPLGDMGKILDCIYYGRKVNF